MDKAKLLATEIVDKRWNEEKKFHQFLKYSGSLHIVGSLVSLLIGGIASAWMLATCDNIVLSDSFHDIHSLPTLLVFICDLCLDLLYWSGLTMVIVFLAGLFSLLFYKLHYAVTGVITSLTIIPTMILCNLCSISMWWTLLIVPVAGTLLSMPIGLIYVKREKEYEEDVEREYQKINESMVNSQDERPF